MKKLQDLKLYDCITTFNRARIRDLDNGELIKVDYNITKRVIEHRFIMNQIYWDQDIVEPVFIVHRVGGKRQAFIVRQQIIHDSIVSEFF